MKPIKVEMKPIRVTNPDIEVKTNESGVADLNVRIKMYEIRVGMKPTGVSIFDAEVKMNETDHLHPGIEVKMKITFHFYPDVEVKKVDNEVRMKTPG